MDVNLYRSQSYLVHKNDFSEFWKKLNSRQINNVRQQIDVLQTRGDKNSTIVRTLQRRPEIGEKWEAERVFNTESKKLESNEAKERGLDRGLKKWYVILEPDACPGCRKLTRNGKKFFTLKEIGSGNNIIIPHHPNCRCSLVPVV